LFLYPLRRHQPNEGPAAFTRFVSDADTSNAGFGQIDLSALAANEPTSKGGQIRQMADQGGALSSPAPERFSQALRLFPRRQLWTKLESRGWRHRTGNAFGSLMSPDQGAGEYLVQGDAFSLEPCPDLLCLPVSLVA